MSLMVVILMIVSFLLGRDYGAGQISIFYRMLIMDIYSRVNDETREELSKAINEIHDGVRQWHHRK